MCKKFYTVNISQQIIYMIEFFYFFIFFEGIYMIEFKSGYNKS